MATSVYLSNPSVTINSVDLTDQCTAATITYTAEALENTAFGSTARTYTAGLYNNSVTVTLYQSYAASETYATLSTLVGTTTTVIVKPATGAESATNPGFTLTGALLASGQEFYKYYGITDDTLALAKPDAIVLHPGPMNRGVEIDSSVADGRQSVILPQVSFGIAIRMAVMSICAGSWRG